jgi:hypothetical protein
MQKVPLVSNSGTCGCWNLVTTVLKRPRMTSKAHMSAMLQLGHHYVTWDNLNVGLSHYLLFGRLVEAPFPNMSRLCLPCNESYRQPLVRFSIPLL